MKTKSYQNIRILQIYKRWGFEANYGMTQLYNEKKALLIY